MLTEIITAILGTLGFAIVFRSKRAHLPLLALGGGISWTVYLLFTGAGLSVPLCFFLASCASGVYSEILARALKTPATTVLIPTVLPLVPGGGLYYTMRFAVFSDYESFLNRGTETLVIAIAIAMGIITVSAAVKLIFAFKRNVYSFAHKGHN